MAHQVQLAPRVGPARQEADFAFHGFALVFETETIL